MRLIRSAGQNVSPSDDGRLYDQIFEDGLFEDATITAAGTNNVSISALYGVIRGRDFTAEAQTLAVTLPESDTATGYIYVEINLSADTIITMGSALSPFTPTYEDINVNGAVAQMIIAEYQASTTAVTSVTPTYSKTSVGGLAPGSIATVETSPTANSYAVGDYLIYNRILYKVTVAIAASESLVEGTNITAAVLTDDLTTLFKTATQSVTPNGAGTFSLIKPSDCTHIVRILSHSQSGTYYTVSYNETDYGIFGYQPPHNPFNSTISVTFLYY